MIGPIALNVHLVNQGVPSATVANLPGFIEFTIILVAFAYLGALVCAKIAHSIE
jgi:hypothetical protein